ncbi:claudin-19-like isoform X1 [Syngnathus acus]|uniref:claudin-19-like isoform X1 n=1 Tax=Syngnathus acus TaxID=161584 RepID=UPI0018863102|nr:claudin-19-like isoform X1 [Syngnathus acus]
MSTGLQICGLVAGVLSWCLQSSCTSSQLWKVRSQAESLMSSQWQYEGLWMTCAATSLGSLQCNKFKTLIGLPVHVQVCRALMMSSLVVGLAAIIVSILGLKCSKVGGGSPQVKGQFLLSGGVMLILSGERTRGANVSTRVAVCLTVRLSFCTGDERVHDDDVMIMVMPTPMMMETCVHCRFELGTGLYLGWAASGLALMGGAMLCCSYRGSSSSSLSSFPNARQLSYNYSKSSQGHNVNIYRTEHASDGNDSTKAYV